MNKSLSMFQQVSNYFSQLGEIEALLLTTFGLDIGYFEKYILPAFFPLLGEGPASEPHRPLFEFLEEHQVPISVIYDANQLVRGEQPLSSEATVLKELRWQAHAVMPKQGFFHPKLVFALVNHQGEKYLVIGCASANLTRPGWAQNFEVCVLEKIKLTVGAKNSLLFDTLALLESLDKKAPDSHAIQIILKEIKNSNPEPLTTRKYSNHYRARMWFGQNNLNLTDWLSQEILHNDLKFEDWKLDVLSPYYSDEIPSLFHWADRQLHTSQTAEKNDRYIRCYCPKVDGQYDIKHETLKYYEEHARVSWSSLPGETLRSKQKDTDGNALERYLHAKVFRFWSKYKEVLVVGSVNATKQGMRDNGNGNYEASLVISRTAQEYEEFSSWLKPIFTEITEQQCSMVTSPVENTEDSAKVPDLDSNFNWESKQLFLHNKDSETLQIFLGNHITPDWVLKSGSQVIEILNGQKIGSIFNSPTLKVKKQSCNNKAWLCLITESSLYAKPPAPSMERTIEELIRDWQLGPEARFTERVGLAGLPDEAHYMTAYTSDSIESMPIEDRLNDVFLAVSKFRKEIETKLKEKDRSPEYESLQLHARLFGRGAMSVRYFAEKLFSSAQGENAKSNAISATEAYISILSLIDMLQILKSKISDAGFIDDYNALLDELHNHYLSALRRSVSKELEKDKDAPKPTELIKWVEQHFSYHGNQFDGHY